MSHDYSDRWIEVSANGLLIRWYYFPAGTKRIPFERIRSVSKVNMGALTGRGRIWGTANPGLWAHLDPGRPRKQVAFIVSTGGSVSSFITPDDPAAFESAFASHCDVAIDQGGRSALI